MLRRRSSCSAVLAVLLVLIGASAPVHSEEVQETPLEVGRRFLRAFEAKDFQAIRSLFAPNAMVASTLLSSSGPHQMDYLTVDEWIKEAEAELSGVQDFKIDPVETSELLFETGATVSIRFRITGRAGKRSFVTDGVDTYAMVRVDGAWRIQRYSYIEQLKFV